MSWARGVPAPPMNIELHPTNLCNCNCLMCGTRAEYRRVAKEDPDFSLDLVKSWEMTDERIIALAGESADLGVRSWLLTGGGEPFVRRKATMALIREIKRLGMNGNINTNGALLTETEVRTIVECGWDMLMFSMDSHEAEVHDRLRNTPRTFERATRAMELFKHWKKRLGTDRPKIVFNSVLFRDNHEKIPQLVEMAGRLGCEDITLIPLIKFDDHAPGLELDESRMAAFEKRIDAVLEVSRRSGVSTNAESFRRHKVEDTSRMDEIILYDLESKGGHPGDPDRTHEETHDAHEGSPHGAPHGDRRDGALDFCETPCFEPYLNVVIQMTGQVSPCCMLSTTKENVKEKSLQEIWHGPYFRRLRTMLASGDLPDGCKTCVFQQVVRTKEIRDDLRERMREVSN